MAKQKFLNSAGVSTLWEAIKSKVSDINTTIKNNELVTATALTDLDTRIDNIEGLVAKTSPIIEKTYEELKSIKMNGQLIPGQQYKITDYITTVDTEYLGGGVTVTDDLHLFDIVVTANTAYGFHEVARAVYNADRDTYFEKSNLDAWKIWYCFDNDRNRFKWASDNGTGVIYRMIDEWNNDCPYDFKNIVMLDCSSTLPGGGLFYTFTVLHDDGNSGREDASLYEYCNNNTIKPACFIIDDEYNYMLNHIIFITKDTELIYGNYLDTGCLYNVFGYGCNYNKLGSNCMNNIFGKYCEHNTIGDLSEENIIGDFNSFNSIGINCYSNTFGNNCKANCVGNKCGHNSFGTGCESNSLGNDCYSNTFDGACDFNNLGNFCKFNSFSTYCNCNSFGNGCENNSFGSLCKYNSFGNGCKNNSFRLSGSKTSSLISYCRYNIFDDGCSNNVIYSSNTNSSTYLENYHINRGVSGLDDDPMLIDAQYLNAENVCNVYKRGNVAVVTYIQY